MADNVLVRVDYISPHSEHTFLYNYSKHNFVRKDNISARTDATALEQTLYSQIRDFVTADKIVLELTSYSYGRRNLVSIDEILLEQTRLCQD